MRTIKVTKDLSRIKVALGAGGRKGGMRRGGDQRKRKVTTHIVIGGIFNSCDGEDENQRHNGGEPGQGRDLGD